MRIKYCLLLLFVSIFFLCSCSDTNSIMNFNSEKYIELYDYASIKVEQDYVQITDKDVENIINAELSANEAYIKINERTNVKEDDIVLISIDGNQEYYFIGSGAYSKEFDRKLFDMKVGGSTDLEIENFDFSNITLIDIYRTATIKDVDFILDYYKLSTFKEVENFIRNRACEEIVFNHSYDIVYENSTFLEFPEEIQNQIDFDIEKYKREILKQYSDFNDFFAENEISEEEFINSVASNYYEIMLYKAILDNEDIAITESDIYDYKNDNDVKGYSAYEIYGELAYQKVRKILISKTQIIDFNK